MGWPALIGLAASAAGTGMQMAASQQEQGKMNEAAQAELTRQNQYRQQSQGQFQQSLAKSGAPVAQQQINTGTQKLQDAYARVAAIPTTLSANANSPSAQFTEDVGTKQFNQQTNASRAGLGGYDEFSIQQWIKNLRTAQQQSLIAGNARASQAVLPLELQAAGQSAESLRGIGSLVSTIGGLASVYGAANPAISYGVGNWSSLSPAMQQAYASMYQYRNNPYSQGYVNPSTYQ